MQLKQYLHENKIEIKDFAKKIDFHPGYVSQVGNFELRPGRKFIKAVEKYTKNIVTEDDLTNPKDFTITISHTGKYARKNEAENVD